MKKNVRNCAHWEHQCKNHPIFYLFNRDTNMVTNMNSGTDMDTGMVTGTGKATSTASETTTGTDMAMNTGTTKDTDTDMVTNTETHIDTDKETGMVMHGKIHEERTRGHADSDTFKFMVTTTATDTGHDWNDNRNGQNITDTATNSVTVMDSNTVTDTDMVTRAGTLIDSHWHEHGNRHGHDCWHSDTAQTWTWKWKRSWTLDMDTNSVTDKVTGHCHKVTDIVMETAMETCIVTDAIELGHGHVHRNDHGHCHWH